MKLEKTNELIIKKSRFIGYLYEVKDETEVKIVLNNLKEEHKNAKHIPYAYVLNNTAGKSDNGEPTNTAGMPLYNYLRIKGVTNKLLIVVRYYGGIKLGSGNLLRAYLNTVKDLL